MASNLSRRNENLALAYQELLTVGERLRGNRQAVSEAESFRHQLREALKGADGEARRHGYTADDVQLATFAIVAFLDESILNLRNEIFADWPRRPLQEELFGHHIAGEIFFQNLKNLLQREETQDTADLLEVYYLCMLLGFAGRYSIGARGDLQAIMNSTGQKIRRIRQASNELSPLWALPPNEAIRQGGNDPWVKRIIYLAIASLLLSLVLFVVYKRALGSAVSTLEEIATQGRS